MNVQKLMVAVVLVGIVGSTGVFAEDAAQPGPKKEGKEHRAGGGDGGFAAADTNKDGVLSLDEFKAMDAARLERIKKHMGDKFDPERMKKMPSADERFIQLDKDASGTLTKEECTAGHQKRGRPGAGEGKGPRKGDGAKKTPAQPETPPAETPAVETPAAE